MTRRQAIVELLLPYTQLSVLLFQVQVALLARLDQRSQDFNQEHVQGAF